MSRKGSKQALFLQGSNCLGADFKADFFAINENCFDLKVRVPHFFGVALRETDVVSVLPALTGDIAYAHDSKSFSTVELYSIGFPSVSQRPVIY